MAVFQSPRRDTMCKNRLKKFYKPGTIKSQKGFTLVEVVIALMLLGLLTAAIFSGLNTASVVLLRNDMRQTAKNLAEYEMESVKNQLFVPGVSSYTPAALPSPQNTLYTATITVIDGTNTTAFNPTLNQSRDANIQKITVNIFRNGSTNPIYQLQGYKVE